MYKCFNVLLNNEFDFFRNNPNYKPLIKDQIKTIKISNFEVPNKNGIALDGSSLIKYCFPNNEKYDIFISHSHKDVEKVNYLSSYLEHELNIKCFIDSNIWLNINHILKEIDNKYALNEESGNYNYYIRNITTSHIHMMLNNALSKMIDCCDCLFFINTENSIDEYRSCKGKTLSPWIMSELYLSSIIRIKEPLGYEGKRITTDHAFIEAGIEKKIPDFLYDVDTSHLKKIQAKDIKNIIYNLPKEKYSRKDTFFKRLYSGD